MICGEDIKCLSWIGDLLVELGRDALGRSLLLGQTGLVSGLSWLWREILHCERQRTSQIMCEGEKTRRGGEGRARGKHIHRIGNESGQINQVNGFKQGQIKGMA